MGLRRQGRIIAFQALYSWEFNRCRLEDILLFNWLKRKENNNDNESLIFAKLLVKGTLENIDEIDKLLNDHIDNWDFSRISKVDLSILRISAYSLLYQKDISGSIIIDEAIDISKLYSSDDSYRFINGVLDGIFKDLNV